MKTQTSNNQVHGTCYWPMMYCSWPKVACLLIFLVSIAAFVGFKYLPTTSEKVAPPESEEHNAKEPLVASNTLPSSPGQDAIEAAAHSEKYAFVLFWKEKDATTQAMKETLQQALVNCAKKTTQISVNINDLAEKSLVDVYDLTRSPVPLVLALAPNGAVTGAFSQRLTKQQVTQAFVSPGMAKTIKGLQNRKLVFVCACPPDTVSAPEGVLQFAANPRYRAATEVIVLKATDSAEAENFKELEINPQTKETVTVLLAPSGNLLGKFSGAVREDQLIQALQTSSSGCGPGGCGPGGCCPPK